MAAHLGTYLQMCGRVLRPYGASQIAELVAWSAASGLEVHESALIPKDRALLIDCTDAARVHGNPTDDRRYSLTGKGIEKLEEEEEVEVDPDAVPVPSETELIEMEFSRVRQQLADTITDLQERAKERGYRDAWVYHRIKEKYGIELPRRYEAKYSSVCTVCRHRVQQGSQIYWMPPSDSNPKSSVKHPDCYIASLPPEVLQLVSAA
jgi:hypothetical protein